MKVSIISATYNRATLLDNALQTYSKQTMPFKDWEYLICDDMSTDDTAEVVKKWQKAGLPLQYFTAAELGYPKIPGKWRDGCTLRNAVSTHAFGEVLVGTHPEIMIPPNALESVYTAAVSRQDRVWVTAIPYWMPNSKMTDGWQNDVFLLTKMDGFYDPSWPDKLHSPGAPDYRNQNEERRNDWESEVFFAMKMEDWRWIGGLRNFEVWGSVDMDFLSRRAAMSVKTVIAKGSPVPSGNLMVFHQYHESKRDMDAAMEACKGTSYPNAESARKAGGLYEIYHHGHRERAIDGNLGGILGDHIARYRFESLYSAGKDVLDVPCGTGYGRACICNAKSYTGIDIDAESIAHANRHYPGARWMIGNMQSIALPDASTDLLLSFEGLEHIQDQATFIREIYRLLRPSGTFIISTPQRGGARGTPWDKYILSADEFYALFDNKLWKNLDWFYQDFYSDPALPKNGKPPSKAEVMILGGTKI